MPSIIHRDDDALPSAGARVTLKNTPVGVWKVIENDKLDAYVGADKTVMPCPLPKVAEYEVF